MKIWKTRSFAKVCSGVEGAGYNKKLFSIFLEGESRAQCGASRQASESQGRSGSSVDLVGWLLS